MESRIKVLYLLAYPRSGTTILGNILGEIRGFIHIGELHYLWERNLLQRRRRCGCGEPIDNCEIWPDVLGPMIDDRPAVKRALELQRSQVRTRHVGGLLSLSAETAWTRPPLREYLQLVSSVYRRAAEISKSHVIVDSSKWPADVAAARLLERDGIHLYPVHMVRDSRKVVFSRQRRKRRSPSGLKDARMRKTLLAYDAMGWNGLNILGEIVLRRFPRGYSRTIRYEDFVQNPRAAVDSILDILHEGRPELPFVRDDTVHLGVNHTLGGNWNRGARGEVTIAEDHLSESGLHSADRSLTTALTLPLLIRYGYLRPPSTGRDTGNRVRTSSSYVGGGSITRIVAKNGEETRSA